MNKTFLTLLNDGHNYSKVWPRNYRLGALFPEPRVIKATQLGITVMPLMAVISVSVQLSYLGPEYLPLALTFALFLLSMPVQGLYWLGKRANTQLPPALASWYREIYGKMIAEGVEPKVSLSKPKYLELGYLLKDVFERMDKAFSQEII
jgi:uncharacterized membrane protein YfbV (UPF0208 family)